MIGFLIIPIDGANVKGYLSRFLQWVSRQELPAEGQEIHPRNMIPPGITSSWKLIQTRKRKMYEKSSKR
jgi:hypothetical protein